MNKYAKMKMREDFRQTLLDMEPGALYSYRMTGRNVESFRVAIYREHARRSGRWEQTNDYTTNTIIVKRLS